MRELPIVERLRERSLELQSTAWSRMDGGQECSLSATLVDEAADTIAALYSDAAFLCARLRELEGDLSDDNIEIVRQYYGHVFPALARMEASLLLAVGERDNG